jgi:hypothetical protein
MANHFHCCCCCCLTSSCPRSTPADQSCHTACTLTHFASAADAATAAVFGSPSLSFKTSKRLNHAALLAEPEHTSLLPLLVLLYLPHLFLSAKTPVD